MKVAELIENRRPQWEELDGLCETLGAVGKNEPCLLYTSPSPRDQRGSRMPSSA